MSTEQEWKEKIEKFYDETISLNTYKEMFHLKKDTFGELESVNSQFDHDKIVCMGYAIKDISKQCFQQCINVHLNDYPKQEQQCIRQCIDSQIKGIHLIIKKFENYQSKRLQEMYQKENQ
ncbi:hypothetical protein ABPG74_016764 [Tetrahymena malaccensis]